MASLSAESVIQKMRTELGDKAELFKPVLVPIDRVQAAESNAAKAPGVCVFLHEDLDCIKVGKSPSNAPKQSLEHCRDNTTSKDGTIEMLTLRHCPKTQILVFALQGNSIHWVLALEHYLENEFKPKIASVRNG